MLSTTCVIPYGGPPEYLRETLLSAASQGFAEIILVNDCRPEPDLEAANGIRQVRILQLDKRSGCAGARNAGVRACHTPFVTFLDADDLLCPDYLSTISAFVRVRGVRCAAASLRYIGKRSDRVGAPLSRDPAFILSSGLICETALVAEAGYFPLCHAEDVPFFNAVRRIIAEISVCHEAKVLYRVHSGSSSSKNGRAMWAFNRLLPLYYGGQLTLEQANDLSTEFAETGRPPAGLDGPLQGGVAAAEARYLARTAYACWLDRDFGRLGKLAFRLARSAPAIASLARHKWSRPLKMAEAARNSALTQRTRL